MIQCYGWNRIEFLGIDPNVSGNLVNIKFAFQITGKYF